MSNLAAKYRPQKMTEMIEQKVVVNIVKNICEADEMSNRNFLFIGPAGVGKTTLAKAIGYALNGNSENVIEIDAASHSGVNDMREIVEQARMYPVGAKYKVFIIDECHALSQSAWQTALKTLEEQPARSIFILATTNPEKIPATILSRVQAFQLSKISLEGIHDRLIYILQQEGYTEVG